MRNLRKYITLSSNPPNNFPMETEEFSLNLKKDWKCSKTEKSPNSFFRKSMIFPPKSSINAYSTKTSIANPLIFWH